MQVPRRPADDIVDNLETVALPIHEFPWVAVLIAAVVVLVLAVAVYVWRRRHPPALSKSLEQGVRRRLSELAAETALDRRAFHAELAGILTRYAEERLGLRGTRLTSAEILSEFQRNGVMGAAWQESLAEFLRECDRAKFAPDFDADWDPRAVSARCRSLFDELAASAAASPHLANPWEGWTNAAV